MNSIFLVRKERKYERNYGITYKLIHIVDKELNFWGTFEIVSDFK